MISVHFQGKPFNITVIQVYALPSNTEEAEQFCEDLQDLVELTSKKDVLFPSQGSNPGLPHYRRILYCLSHRGSLVVYFYILNI